MDFFDNNTSSNANNNFEQILHIANDTAFSSSSSSSLIHFQEYNNENFERFTNSAINNFFNFQNDITLNGYIPTYYPNRENEEFIINSNNNIVINSSNNGTCDSGTSMLINSDRTGKFLL